MTDRETTLVAVTDIIIQDDRQRKDLGDLTELKASIQSIGLINPITITAGNELVAGERRLTAIKELGLTHASCIRLEDLTESEVSLIELEENVKRKDLKWEEHAAAAVTLHNILVATKDRWSQAKTASYMGISEAAVARLLAVGNNLDNPRFKQAATLRAAHNILERERKRAADNDMNELLDTLASPKDSQAFLEKAKRTATGEFEEEPEEADIGVAPIAKPTYTPTYHINQADFVEWASTYRGKKFNFLHCDFPYGINHDSSAQGGADAYGSYADSEDVYWELCQALVDNIDNILYPSAHIMFWFSMKFYHETLEFFEVNCPELDISPIPLIWHKSDNKGIVSDVERQPRNIYETAFHITRGDRKILMPIANVYSCPTNKSEALHQSEKPEPMLRHFFRMYADHFTEMLDPTCGGGSSIRAAMGMKAKRAVGLDLNPEYVDIATRAMRQFQGKELLHAQLNLDEALDD